MGRQRSGVWVTLAYLMLMRASELFTEDYGRLNSVYCLRGEDEVFYAGQCQVEGGDSPTVDTVKVHFRGSMGVPGRKGDVLMRMKCGGDKGGEAVELLQKMYR